MQKNKKRGGWKLSEETKKKMSENGKKRVGQKNGFYGHKLSPEHKNIAIKNLKTDFWLGKKRSVEDRKKMSLAWNKKSKRNWKDGRTKDKNYVSWMKNKRNRLRGYQISIGQTHSWGEWELLIKQYDFICPSCRKKEPEIILTEDHIIPLSKGGSDLIENIQPLCLKCNMKKHTKIIKF